MITGVRSLFMNDRVDHDCATAVADCQVRAATDLFLHTWNPVVLAALAQRPLRRGALRSSIGGISDKVLTETLHRLGGSGLIERRAAPVGRAVEYALTPLGRSLFDGPLQALGAWAAEHGEELLDAQDRAAS
jgi:DNA-binding HxlR family transcriptional regulator